MFLKSVEGADVVPVETRRVPCEIMFVAIPGEARAVNDGSRVSPFVVYSLSNSAVGQAANGWRAPARSRGTASNGTTRRHGAQGTRRCSAKTGRRYEYQYERAARRALTLLDHQQKHVCVYCDWHDDFVVERGDPPTRYIFHQVKGRKSGLGPWAFNDFFGLTRRVSLPLPASAKYKKDAIVPLMLLHYNNFPDSCEGIAFVTNTGLEPQLQSFMDGLKSVATRDQLSADDRTALDFIALAYLAGKKPLALSHDVLFEQLRSISLWLDEPHLDDENFAVTELVDLIEQYSEINLVYAQPKNIAREVINKVRLKAHHDKTSIPATEAQLRRDKGIVVTELLGVQLKDSHVLGLMFSLIAQAEPTAVGQ